MRLNLDVSSPEDLQRASQIYKVCLGEALRRADFMKETKTYSKVLPCARM